MQRQEGMAKAQEEEADLKPIPLPYPMELVEMRIKDKKFVKTMQGKDPSQVKFFFVCRWVGVESMSRLVGGGVSG